MAKPQPAVKARRGSQPALREKLHRWFVGFGNGCGFVAIVALPLYYLLGVWDLGVVGGVLRSGVALVGISSVVLALLMVAGVMATASVYDRVAALIHWMQQNKKAK